jgi:hypothetical protein
LQVFYFAVCEFAFATVVSNSSIGYLTIIVDE